MKMKDQQEYIKMLMNLSVPDDAYDLLELVEYLFLEKNNEETVKLHKKFYTAAEKRFSDNPVWLNEVKKYKVKKFGLF